MKVEVEDYGLEENSKDIDIDGVLTVHVSANADGYVVDLIRKSDGEIMETHCIFDEDLAVAENQQ